MATTSGTVSAYPFNQRKVIDHAARRAGRVPQKLSGEDIAVATDLIYTLTSQWITAGYPLWTLEYLLLPITAGSRYVTLPVGINDVFHSYWRILNPFRGTATLSSGGDGSSLFGGQPNTDVVIAGPNPGVIANFGGPNELDTIGVLLGNVASVTAALEVQTSQDGQTFTTAQTLPSTTFAAGVWSYFDLAPVITAPFIQLVNPVTGSWTLNQLNFGLAQGQDIELGPLNQDDQYNLPDKQFQNPRPVSAFLDRQLIQPVLNLWPAPDISAFYNGTVTALVRRYIQDPGALTNNAEVPQRWLEALIWRLAALLMFELPEEEVASGSSNIFALQAKQQRMQMVEQKATGAELLAWSEEKVRAPIRMAPVITCYTA